MDFIGRIGSSGVASVPVLWQLQLSHYNEKVRWALDYKRIPHRRRSLLPGVHALVARCLTQEGATTPVLTLEGRSIGDSTKIIAELERRWPDPPLYPGDRAQLARALELEEFFDEQLGPHVRRAAYQELLAVPQAVLPLFTNGQRPAARVLLRLCFPLLRGVMRRAMQVSPAEAQRSRGMTLAAIERLEAEIGPSGYLVGERFSVADLTAAALLYPVVRPPEFPYPQVGELPPEPYEFLESLARRPAGRWVADMYRRERHCATPR